jgi:hypothetical protein
MPYRSQARWARTVALPEINRLVFAGRRCAAMRLVGQAEPYLRGDPEIEGYRKDLTYRLPVRTDPAGADVYIRDYVDVADAAEWSHLGRTPLEPAWVSIGVPAYKIVKPGFETVEGMIDEGDLTAVSPVLQTALKAERTVPAGMIWIPAQQDRRADSESTAVSYSKARALLSFIQTAPVRLWFKPGSSGRSAHDCH